MNPEVRPSEGLFVGDKLKLAKVFIKNAPHDLEDGILNVRVKEVKLHADGTKEIWFQKEE